MAAYVTQQQIETAIPAPHLLDALDDDKDGVADSGLLDRIIAQACQAVDGYLQALYEVPIQSPPPLVRDIAFIFAVELIYARREIGGDDKRNPWTAQANAYRKQLREIASGEVRLDATRAVVAGSMGLVVVEPATIDGSTT